MPLEDPHLDGEPEPWVADLDALWLYWADARPERTGRALRRDVFASFTSGLASRWPHGGYRFRFAEEPRTSGRAPLDDTARALLRALFPDLREAALAWTWRDPEDALDDFLDRWLVFREHRPWVRSNDVADSMLPALRAPWAACVRELVEGASGARAAVLDGASLAGSWGDHGVALVIAAGPRGCVFHVALWTD